MGLAQIGLLAAWLAWGRRLLLVRVLALAGGLALWSWPMGDWIPNGYAHWLFVLTAYAVLIAGALAALRMAGVTLIDPALYPFGGSHNQSRQYSLWTLLSLMTGAAVLTGLLRLAAIPWDSLFEAGIFIASFASLAVVSLLIGGGIRRPSRLTVAILSVAALGTTWFAMLGATRHYWLICGILSGYLVFSMQTLRTVGITLRAHRGDRTAPSDKDLARPGESRRAA